MKWTRVVLFIDEGDQNHKPLAAIVWLWGTCKKVSLVISGCSTVKARYKVLDLFVNFGKA